MAWPGILKLQHVRPGCISSRPARADRPPACVAPVFDGPGCAASYGLSRRRRRVCGRGYLGCARPESALVGGIVRRRRFCARCRYWQQGHHALCCSSQGSTHLDTYGFSPATASLSPLRADLGGSGTSSLLDLSPASLCEEAALHDTRSANHVRDSLRPSDPPPPYSYRGLLCHDAHTSTSVVRVRVSGDVCALKIVPRRSRDCAREVGAFRRLREQSTTTPFLNYARELWEDESQCYFIMVRTLWAYEG
jgi:hypothetical protein